MNAITLYDKIADGGMGAIKQLGEAFAASGLFGCTKKEQGIAMLITCMAENLSPSEYQKTYHLVTIEGKTTQTMRSDAMLAKFQQAGGSFHWVRSTEKEAVLSLTYDGHTTEVSFTMDDARRAGLAGKNTWKNYPDAMLRARCASKGIRMVCPMINFGVYTPEEVRDFDNPRAPVEPLLRDVPASVVDEPPPEKAAEEKAAQPGEDIPARMEENEAAVNAYLLQIKYLKDGQTWRDLSEGHRNTVFERFDTFIAKALEHGKKGETA
jgi:hypothetical protein